MEEVKACKLQMEDMRRELEMMRTTALEAAEIREKIEKRMTASLIAANAVPKDIAGYEDGLHELWDGSGTIHEKASALLERYIRAEVGKVRAGGSLEEFEARVEEQLGVFRNTIQVFFEKVQPQWDLLAKDRVQQMALMTRILAEQGGLDL